MGIDMSGTGISACLVGHDSPVQEQLNQAGCIEHHSLLKISHNISDKEWSSQFLSAAEAAARLGLLNTPLLGMLLGMLLTGC